MGKTRISPLSDSCFSSLCSGQYFMDHDYFDGYVWEPVGISPSAEAGTVSSLDFVHFSHPLSRPQLLDHCYFDGYAGEPVGSSPHMELGPFTFSETISLFHCIILTSIVDSSTSTATYGSQLVEDPSRDTWRLYYSDSNSWILLLRRLLREPVGRRSIPE